jgi:hypothetical protein
VRVLLDECVDWRLSRALTGHEVKSARQMGWSAIKNGELLELASERFDAFVTVDRNLAFQQNARSLSIPVIVLHAKTNRLADLLPLVPNLLTAIGSAKPGLVTTVDAWPSLFLILRPARLLALHPLLLLLAQPVVVRAVEAGWRSDATISRSTPPGC